MNSLKIQGLVVPIEEKDLPDSYAEWHSKPTPIIYVDGKLPEDQAASAIFHEALHALESFFGINLLERNIRILEMAIPQLLKENRELREGLLADNEAGGEKKARHKRRGPVCKRVQNR